MATIIWIEDILNRLKSKVKMLTNLKENSNDAEMLEYRIRQYLTLISNVQKNFSSLSGHKASAMIDSVLKSLEKIDQDIRDAREMRLDRLDEYILNWQMNLPIIQEIDWMKEYRELLQKQIDDIRTAVSTGYLTDATLEREINGISRRTEEMANFITHLDSVHGILIASDKQIEILSGSIYEYNENELKYIRAEVQKVKESIYKMKSNKPEGNLEEIARELLESIQEVEQRIRRLKTSIERKKENNRKIINETKERLNLMRKRIKALLSDERLNTRVNCLRYKKTIKDAQEEMDVMEGKIYTILSTPNQPKLFGSDPLEICYKLDSIYSNIEHIEQQPMPGVFEYLGAFLNILAELIARPFLKLSELIRPSQSKDSRLMA